MVGIAGAAVLGAAAGARRTQTSLDRFERATRSADVEVDVGDATAAQLAAFRREPNVATVAELRELAISLHGEFLPLAAAVDSRFGTIVDRPDLVAGRLQRLSAPDELVISPKRPGGSSRRRRRL